MPRLESFSRDELVAALEPLDDCLYRAIGGPTRSEIIISAVVELAHLGIVKELLEGAREKKKEDRLVSGLFHQLQDVLAGPAGLRVSRIKEFKPKDPIVRRAAKIAFLGSYMFPGAGPSGNAPSRVRHLWTDLIALGAELVE